MADRRTRSLVRTRCLRLAQVFIAACSSNEGPTGPRADSAPLYVANAGSVPGIVVYAAGASGNVTPVQAIAGGNTVLAFTPSGIARDVAGNLYVTSFPQGNWGGGSITVYARNAMGDAAPIRRIAGDSTGLYHPSGIALDTAGSLYVPAIRGVAVYAHDASGNAPPTRTIEISASVGAIALDIADNLYVASGDSILVYAAVASGNVTPTRMIAGSNTALNCPAAIAVDATAELYVANPCSHAITVYARGANGNAPPVRTIAGSATGLNGPSGVALDAGRNQSAPSLVATLGLGARTAASAPSPLPRTRRATSPS